MDERENERDLEPVAVESPMGSAMQEVTPLREAMDRILVGMTMCMITLNFFALNYLLPTIGMVLLLRGFYALRSENICLRVCWRLMLFRAVMHFFLIVINATIFGSLLYESPIGKTITILGFVVQLLIIIYARKAITLVQKKADMPVQTESITALLVWYLAFICLALVGYSGWLLALVMLGTYIVILRRLYGLSEEMEQCKYNINVVKASAFDQKIGQGITVAFVGAIACGYLFLGSYDMDWRQEERVLSTEINAIKKHLIALGYPEFALNDLSEEDILACKDAKSIVFRERNQPVNDGRQVEEKGGETLYISTVYDEKELHFTDVAVELPSEGTQWRIFHHFLWTVDPGFHGTEVLELWPAYQHEEGWIAKGELTGRVLYDQKDVVYVAPFYTLAEKSFIENDVFWGNQSSRSVFATFSMPNTGAKHRGYISYGIETVKEGYMIDSWVNYTHQKSKFQYPVRTAEEMRKTSSWNDAYPFITVQEALQFYNAEGRICFLGEDNE